MEENFVSFVGASGGTRGVVIDGVGDPAAGVVASCAGVGGLRRGFDLWAYLYFAFFLMKICLLIISYHIYRDDVVCIMLMYVCIL